MIKKSDKELHDIVEPVLNKRLLALRLKIDDYPQFRDSLQAIVFENNSQALINQSDKDLQKQTLDIMLKMRKDFRVELDSIDSK